MFGALGEITFDLVGSPQGLESSREYTYAEQKTVQGRPRLQWMSEALETLTLTMMFHAALADPATQMQALENAARDHQARALVFGDGTHRGYFVVTAIRAANRQMTAQGGMVAIVVTVTLREWAMGSEISPSAPPKPATPPLAVIPVTSSGGSTTLLTASGAQVVPFNGATAGASALASSPGAAGAPSAHIAPDDVATSAIVRMGQG